MSASAIVMMCVYLCLVWGGLAVGAVLMARHDDDSAGTLPPGWTPLDEVPGRNPTGPTTGTARSDASE